MAGRIYKIVDYRPEWLEQFQQEKRRIEAQLAGLDITVHHIGSTSVPNLAAKALIDILVEVSDLALLDQRNEAMAAIGYLAKGEFGIARRRYFQKGGDARSHHLHAFAYGDEHAHRHLAFRDYLIAHPDVAKQYAEVKRQAAAQCNNQSTAYMALKNDFVQLHEQAALRWAAKA